MARIYVCFDNNGGLIGEFDVTDPVPDHAIRSRNYVLMKHDAERQWFLIVAGSWKRIELKDVPATAQAWLLLV